MRTIIAGSRWITDKGQVFALIDHAVADLNLPPITEVVSGGASGIDQLGEAWARERGIPIKAFPADWQAHGKKAGPMRNVQMADYAEGLIAIWDGLSRGTKHMIDVARRRNFPMVVLQFNEGNRIPKEPR